MRDHIRQDLVAGARAMLPWLAGVTPFGLVIGVAAAQADIPAAAGWLTAPTIYGGSAQLAAIQLLDAGAVGGAVLLWVVWLAALAVGVTAGARVPSALHLELLAPLYILGEMVPRLRDVAARRAVLTSAGLAVAGLALPLHLGIVVATVGGLAVGGITLGRQRAPAAGSDMRRR